MAATNDDWRAAAMMLERKYPERSSRYRERSAFEAGNLLARADFVISIHLGNRSDEDDDEQLRQKVIDVTPIAVAAPKDPDPNPNLN